MAPDAVLASAFSPPLSSRIPSEGYSPAGRAAPSAPAAFQDSETIVQTTNSALLVRLTAPFGSAHGRSLVGTEILRRERDASPFDGIPAVVRADQSVRPEPDNSYLPVLHQDVDERAAAFRALRRRLAEQGDPAVVLVTSAQEGEGKSTCAANLALAMAESGRQRVLLVEAHLRQPKLAEIFGFRPVSCLSVQLTEHREHRDAPWQTTEIQPTGLQVLAVSPDARRDQNLHGPSFSMALAQWRLAFDHVVVDGPAILSSCDASIIQEAVDAVVIVARSGATRNRFLRRALEQISANAVAGIVLMDSRETS